MSLPVFSYDLLTGPVETPSDITSPISKGNCRLAVQVYFHYVHGVWLRVDQILCPNLFRSSGILVQEAPIDVSQLKEGDVILAERIRGKDGGPIDKSRAAYSTEDEWIIYLHSAVVKNASQEKSGTRIWHSTSTAGGTCEWTWDEFEYYYRPIRVKRIL